MTVEEKGNNDDIPDKAFLLMTTYHKNDIDGPANSLNKLMTVINLMK